MRGQGKTSNPQFAHPKESAGVGYPCTSGSLACDGASKVVFHLPQRREDLEIGRIRRGADGLANSLVVRPEEWVRCKFIANCRRHGRLLRKT